MVVVADGGNRVLKPTRAMLEQAKKDMQSIVAEIVNEIPNKDLLNGKEPGTGDIMVEAAKRWRERNPDSPLFREKLVD